LREEAIHQLGELRVVARRAEDVPRHVVPDVEVRIRLPRGVRDPERHVHHAVRVARDEMEARRQVGQLPLVVERTRDQIDAGHVQELARPLEVQKRRVERAQAIAGSLRGGHAAQVPSSTNVTCTVARYSAILPFSTAAFSFSTSIPVMPRSVLLARSSAFRTASSQLWGDAPMICVMRATAILDRSSLEHEDHLHVDPILDDQPALHLDALLHHLDAGDVAERARRPLTAAGVALGVALVVAIRVINASTLAGFTEAIEDLAGTAALQVRGPGPFSETIADRLRALPEVDHAVPIVTATFFAVDPP